MRRSALNRWLVVQACVWLPVLVIAAVRGPVALAGPPAVALLVAGLASFATLAWALGGLPRAADQVTAARFALFLGAAAWCAADGAVTWTAWGLLAAAVALDLADGAVARRRGGSEAGAVLDMETDQLVTLGLALLASGLAGAGAQALALPAFRHAWVLVQRGMGLPLHDPKPRDGDNRTGRRICALMMVLLLAAVAPGAAPGLREAALWVAVAALGYSYAGDVRHVLDRRRSARGTE